MISNDIRIISEPFQGSDEWLELRLSKITATDARVIMGVDPWKTLNQLYIEKTEGTRNLKRNYWMDRGVELEDEALKLFQIQQSISMSKKTVVKDWALASLDGMSECNSVIVEIKCPGESDHKKAINGHAPPKYYPQLQFQMYVCDVPYLFYCSFDGFEIITIKVDRDDEYINDMIEKCEEFYEAVQKKIAPKASEEDYSIREDFQWHDYASDYIEIKSQIDELTIQQEEIKKKLIYISMSKNSMGSGIRLKSVERIGNIDYSKIEELKHVNVEKYRKPTTKSWRIIVD